MILIPSRVQPEKKQSCQTGRKRTTFVTLNKATAVSRRKENDQEHVTIRVYFDLFRSSKKCTDGASLHHLEGGIESAVRVKRFLPPATVNKEISYDQKNLHPDYLQHTGLGNAADRRFPFRPSDIGFYRIPAAYRARRAYALFVAGFHVVFRGSPGDYGFDRLRCR